MKRSVSYLMASVIAVSTLGMQALPVFAEETVLTEENPIQINTAQDFVNVYLSTKTVTIVDEVEVENYILFSEVDENNYFSVLAANSFYESLSSDYTIDETTQLFVLKSDEQKVTDALLKEEIDTYLLVNQIDYAAMLQEATQIYVEQQEESEKEEASEEKEETNTEVVEEVKEDAEEKEEVVVEEEVKEEAKGKKVEKVVEEKVEAPEVAVEKTVTTKAKPTKAQNTTDASAAQSFVQTYLTSSSGVVYAAGNTINYQNILNSLSAWNKLSSSQQSAVNSILSSKANTSYAKLLQDAQQIKANGGTAQNTSYDYTQSYAYVNTATQTNAGLYTMLCAVSLAAMGLITRRKKEIQ